ncbi:MAG: RHS repeat-associated core domain-containing protein [Vicinamibacteria bacterium]
MLVHVHVNVRGDEIWVTQTALDDEASGYYLIPAGDVPAGWSAVSDAEAADVWGKGNAGNNDQQECKECSKQKGPGCPDGGCGAMAGYSVHAVLVSLNLKDTPVGYTPPRGPSVNFRLNYIQRDSFQPSIFYYSNLGPRWTFDWLSYVEDNPSDPSQSAFVFLRGGGQETSSGYDAGTQAYAPHYQSHAVLARTSTSPVRYERRLPDGSVEVFEQSDGAASFPRKVFMTQAVDPQGNAVSYTYDANLRLVAVTDAIGQVTTLSYELPADDLKITKVTDPFGRYASFSYNAAGQLESITDVIGIQSSFTYGTSDTVTALTTPYGTTKFDVGQNASLGAMRWVEITDPLGGVERVEYRNSAPGGLGSEPAAVVPAGLTTATLSGFNTYMNGRNTYYWGKRAMALYPRDYSKAEITHWLHLDFNTAAGIVESEKKPLENRVWYTYAGQSAAHVIGTGSQPMQVARVLDDGTTQMYQYEYNQAGKKIKETDPLGRETVYVYGNNNTPDAVPATGSGLDLLQVKRKNPSAPGGYETLRTYTYNANHQPLTSTDAGGAVTTYTYTATGLMNTIQTPAPAGHPSGPTTTFSYDTDSRLSGIAGPVSGATQSFTYDVYGRRRTSTDATAYTLTYDYDALDRVTKVTHPDTTYEETVYNRLDAEKRHDRAGRWSETFYDALRRVVATKDPANGSTTFEWCACGSLDALVDAKKQRTGWEYDLQGRKTKETRPDGAEWVYAYETTTSRLKTVTDAKNQTTTFAYFNDNRLQAKSYSEGSPSVTFTYDANSGLPLTAANGVDTLSWTYDADDRLASEASTKNASTVAYAYDGPGNRTSLSLNGTTFSTYGYDVTSRLASITRNSNVFSFGYDTPSRRTSMLYPNGVSTAYGYDSESRVTSIAATYNSTPVTSFGYTYDVLGNRTTKTTLEGTEGYGYDALSRLTSADRNFGAPTRWRWAYDAVGNRTDQQTDNAPRASSHNVRNQLTATDPGGKVFIRGSLNEAASVTIQGKPATVAADNTYSGTADVTAGTTSVAIQATDPSGNVRTSTYDVSASGTGAAFTYDANGNMAQKVEGGDTWAYEWTVENELKRVLKNAVEQASFKYDPSGRRVEKVVGGVTTTYTYDGKNILRQVAGSTTTLFVQGAGIDEPLASEVSGTLSYYHADALGSIVKVTNQSVSTIHSYQYDAWGNILAGGTLAGPAFTGREWDPEIGLYYYRARYYDPSVGRFAAEDPIGLEGGWNRFGYALSNPVIYTDPDGLRVVNCGEVAVLVKPETGGPGLLPPKHVYEGNPDGVMDDTWIKFRGRSGRLPDAINRGIPENDVTVCPPSPEQVRCKAGPCLVPFMMVRLPGPPDETWEPPAIPTVLPNIRPVRECECQGACQ